MAKKHRKKDQRCKGQAYTEFVVVLPGLLLLLLLAWEFAYFWWGRMVVSTATFEAARVVASGESVGRGYEIYDDILEGGLGQMAGEHQGGFHLRPNYMARSVTARARVPWRWPSGLGALMGGGMNLDLRSSAHFRLERFWPGPPGWYGVE
jgi:hypothetical protein